MKRQAKIITVFGSSRPREGEAHYAQAQALGAALAAQGLVVCSGGYGGVMEAVSRGAKEAGRAHARRDREIFQAVARIAWVDEEVRANTWQERLFELVKRGHGYVTCTGGTGTLVELAVVWEMLNKGAMSRQAVRGARRFLAADDRARARSRAWAFIAMG